MASSAEIASPRMIVNYKTAFHQGSFGKVSTTAKAHMVFSCSNGLPPNHFGHILTSFSLSLSPAPQRHSPESLHPTMHSAVSGRDRGEYLWGSSLITDRFSSHSPLSTPPIEESVLQSGVHMAHDLRRQSADVLPVIGHIYDTHLFTLNHARL